MLTADCRGVFSKEIVTSFEYHGQCNARLVGDTAIVAAAAPYIDVFQIEGPRVRFVVCLVGQIFDVWLDVVAGNVVVVVGGYRRIAHNDAIACTFGICGDWQHECSDEQRGYRREHVL